MGFYLNDTKNQETLHGAEVEYKVCKKHGLTHYYRSNSHCVTRSREANRKSKGLHCADERKLAEGRRRKIEAHQHKDDTEDDYDY